MKSTKGIAGLTSLADLLADLGGIAADRVLFRPAPGRATERDLLRINERKEALCELVDGVLVEKPMGARESLLALVISQFIRNYLMKHGLGTVLGADGMLRLRPNLVRAPDVSFISWDRIEGDEFPDDPIPELAPDLAVEVLSEGNTQKEMESKVREYFAHGARLVWIVDPRNRGVDVYTSPDDRRRLRSGQTLDGGDVLPRFRLPLRKLFAQTRRPRRR
jgi:Uma2 family endonuclease